PRTARRPFDGARKMQSQGDRVGHTLHRPGDKRSGHDEIGKSDQSHTAKRGFGSRPWQRRSRDRRSGTDAAGTARPCAAGSEGHPSPDTNVANFLRGRVVFVGSAIQPGFAGDRRDQFKTPYWRESAWPGVDFHATQFLNLWRGDWLRRPNPFLELFVIALGGL